jgi:hypothetical protein
MMMPPLHLPTLPFLLEHAHPIAPMNALCSLKGGERGVAVFGVAGRVRPNIVPGSRVSLTNRPKSVLEKPPRLLAHGVEIGADDVGIRGLEVLESAGRFCGARPEVFSDFVVNESSVWAVDVLI